MSEEIVRIKGTKAGLQLLFAAGATYAAIEADIREKLAAGSGFFCRGTVMHALAGSLPEEEMDAYVRRATRFGSWKEMLDTATDLYARRQLLRE